MQFTVKVASAHSPVSWPPACASAGVFKARMMSSRSASFKGQLLRPAAASHAFSSPPRPRLAQRWRQIARRDFIAPAQHHGVLEGGAQLAARCPATDMQQQVGGGRR